MRLIDADALDLGNWERLSDAVCAFVECNNDTIGDKPIQIVFNGLVSNTAYLICNLLI